MEESLMRYIVTSGTKIMVSEEKSNYRRAKHFLVPYSIPGEANSSEYYFPLLNSDDEGFEFFLAQQRSKKKYKLAKTQNPVKNVNIQKTKSSPSKEYNQMETNKKDARKVHIELNLLNEFDENNFECNLHMKKHTFLKLFKAIQPFLLRSFFPPTITPQTAFSLALWKVTTDEHYEEISRKFRVPLTDCKTSIRRFWSSISNNCKVFIQWPITSQSQQKTLEEFHLNTNLESLGKVFGIVGIKRMDIFLESEDEEVAVIVQIICNSTQKVIDCFVEFAQQYYFDSSPIGQMLVLNDKSLPRDSFLIGDKTFPLRPYLMRPYEVVNSQQETFFNSKLEPALKIAHRVLDTMAKRFNALYALEARDLYEVRKIMETVCALHNLCIDNNDEYFEEKRDIAFNWASSNGNINVIGNELDQEGVTRRLEITEAIEKDVAIL